MLLTLIMEELIYFDQVKFSSTTKELYIVHQEPHISMSSRKWKTTHFQYTKFGPKSARIPKDTWHTWNPKDQAVFENLTTEVER